MADYIERKAILDELNDIKYTWQDYNEVEFALMNIPAADVAPVVHGRWDGDADGYYNGELVYDHWFCSECDWDDGGSLEEKPNYNYCPNCGARMDGGAE